MDNYDPFQTVHQLRAWVEESLSSPDTVATATTRYREIIKVIDQLKKLDIPISPDIKSEKKSLEEFIRASEKIKKLTDLANELSTLSRDINRHLRKLEGGKTSSQKLRVIFSDGMVIFENKAVDTFIKSFQYIGLEHVSELKSIRSHGGHPIVSREENESAGQVRKIDGYFIETHSSTEQKARYIQGVAKALHLEISVELIDS